MMDGGGIEIVSNMIYLKNTKFLFLGSKVESVERERERERGGDMKGQRDREKKIQRTKSRNTIC